MQRLQRLAESATWKTVTEDPGVWVAEADLADALPDLQAVRSLLRDRHLTLGSICAGRETLAQFEPDGSVRLLEAVDQRLTALDAERQERAWTLRQQADYPGLDDAVRQTAIVGLIEMVQAPDEPLTLRIELHKGAALREERSRYPDGLQIWLNADRFSRWFGALGPLDQIGLFGGPAPLLVAAPNPVADLRGYRFGHIPLTEISHPPAAEFRQACGEYQEAFAERIRRISGNSDGPVVLPEAFDLTDPAIMQPEVRRAAAYALLADFAGELVRKGESEVAVQIPGATGSIRGTVAVGAAAFRSAGGTVPITPGAVAGLREVCRKRQETLRESDAYRTVWAAAVEAALQGEPLRLLEQPLQVLSRFADLRDRLLAGNLEKLLGAVEKAHTALSQTTGQINKDVDSIAGDVEKAIIGTLTSGVLTLAGAVLKTGALDLMGPLVSALALVIYLPFLLHRLRYFQQSIGRRQADFDDLLPALSDVAGEIPGSSRVGARFKAYKDAAADQVSMALGWIRALAAILLLLLTVAAVLSMKPGRIPWPAAGPVVGAVVMVRFPELRANRWIWVLSALALLSVAAAGWVAYGAAIVRWVTGLAG